MKKDIRFVKFAQLIFVFAIYSTFKSIHSLLFSLSFFWGRLKKALAEAGLFYL